MTRVLIVDDNRDSADTLSVLLQIWGHETRKAYDGESVVQHALAFEPEVVLLDLGLPRLDGFGVARKIREFQKLMTVKIAAVTGFTTTSDIAKCRDAGFDEHFAKPIASDRLHAYLSHIEAPQFSTTQD